MFSSPCVVRDSLARLPRTTSRGGRDVDPYYVVLRLSAFMAPPPVDFHDSVNRSVLLERRQGLTNARELTEPLCGYYNYSIPINFVKSLGF
jgi:hypothetical protein